MSATVKALHIVDAADLPEVLKGSTAMLVAFVDADGKVIELGGDGGGVAVTWATLGGKPAVIAAGADADAARTAIGAGTSSLAVGATAGAALAAAAAAGTSAEAARADHAHKRQTAAETSVSAGAGVVGATVQAAIADLAARVVVLESAAG